MTLLLQSDINHIRRWDISNFMQLSFNKTTVISSLGKPTCLAPIANYVTLL